MMTNEGYDFGLLIIPDTKNTQKKGMQAAQLLNSRALFLKGGENFQEVGRACGVT
jgi:hypothetical protein